MGAHESGSPMMCSPRASMSEEPKLRRSGESWFPAIMMTGTSSSSTIRERVDHRKVTDLELFCDFYAQVTGDKLSDKEEATFVAILQRAQAEKEAAAS
jgi:hypothetical protein